MWIPKGIFECHIKTDMHYFSRSIKLYRSVLNNYNIRKVKETKVV